MISYRERLIMGNCRMRLVHTARSYMHRLRRLELMNFGEGRCLFCLKSIGNIYYSIQGTAFALIYSKHCTSAMPNISSRN
jgi:hypothetical protein